MESDLAAAPDLLSIAINCIMWVNTHDESNTHLAPLSMPSLRTCVCIGALQTARKFSRRQRKASHYEHNIIIIWLRRASQQWSLLKMTMHCSFEGFIILFYCTHRTLFDITAINACGTPQRRMPERRTLEHYKKDSGTTTKRRRLKLRCDEVGNKHQ